MNPLTNVKNITKLNEREISLGTKVSWHDQYKNSAWVFIGGLPYDLTEGDIICVFSQWGEIVNINLIRDKKSGKSKGFCFLCYENQKSTVLAVDNFNGIKIVGRTIRVDHVENYKPPKEREDDDEITKTLYSEGCAPKLITLEKDNANLEEGKRSTDLTAFEKKRKKKKKEKTKKKSKERKKKKSKKRKVSNSGSNESSSSSSSTEDEKAVVIKREKYDPGYDVHLTNNPPREVDKPTNQEVVMGSESPRNRSDDNLERFRQGSEKKDFNSRANYRTNNRDSKERTAGWRNNDKMDKNERRNEDVRNRYDKRNEDSREVTRDRIERRNEDIRDRNERRNEDVKDRNERRNEDARDRNDRRNEDARGRNDRRSDNIRDRNEVVRDRNIWRNEDSRDRNERRNDDARDRNERRNDDTRDRNDRRNEDSRDRLNDRRTFEPKERSEDKNLGGHRSKDRYLPNDRNQRFRDRSNDRRPSSRDRMEDSRRFGDRSNDRNRDHRGRSPDPRRRSPDSRNRNFRDRSSDRRSSVNRSTDRRK